MLLLLKKIIKLLLKKNNVYVIGRPVHSQLGRLLRRDLYYRVYSLVRNDRYFLGVR